MDALWIALGVGTALVVWVIVVRNRFVHEREHVRESWSTVDTELQRRHELVPNLVEVVRAHAAHERATLEAVITARATAVSCRSSGADDRAPTEQLLVRELGRLLAVAEAYPEIRADQSYGELMRHLVSTEDRIAAARRVYNSNVRIYEQHRQRFPSMLVASAFRFGPEPWFTAEDAATELPTVRIVP